jgi:hypothetical protein
VVAETWSIVLLPLIFGAPWIAAIAWVGYLLHRTSGDREVFPSAAEMVRRRLWTN